jgi:hypothetical protein
MKGCFFSAVLCLITITGFSQQDVAEAGSSSVKVTPATGNGTQETAQVPTLISPVSVKGKELVLDLQSLQKDKYTITLYNKDGRKFLLKTVNVDADASTETCLLPEQVKPGIYILQVISKTARMSFKLVVE